MGEEYAKQLLSKTFIKRWVLHLDMTLIFCIEKMFLKIPGLFAFGQSTTDESQTYLS